MAVKLQTMLFQAMTDPAFYPHEVRDLSQRETHISKVFLTGPCVYKIKKPVDLGFVNFTSLEQRRYFCEQEVLLNERLTDGVYLGVIPISYDGRRFGLNTSGQVVEYAVKMRQLPPTATMRSLLAEQRISSGDLDRLAARLADFHKTAHRVKDPAVRINARSACTENFRQIMPYTGRMLDAGQYDFIRAATFNFLIRNKELFEKRIATGHFRDGHGDLRTEHVYFTMDGRIHILDCIEFNERLRLVDTASDLAFLVMDLESQFRSEAARDLLQTYYERCDDIGMPALMDFYKCYRAMVRCKVSCIRLGSHGLSNHLRSSLTTNAQCYLHLAHFYARRFIRPTIWVFCGLPGSGKSTLAAKLAELLVVENYNSDRMRKQMAGLSPLARANGPADKGIYGASMSTEVYDRLYAMALRTVAEGRSLILDATYSTVSHRDKLRHLADDCGVRIIFAECRTGDDGLRKRLTRRENTPSVSDARAEHLGLLKARFAALSEIPPTQHLVLDTGRSKETCLRELLTATYLNIAHKWPGMPSRLEPSLRSVQEPVA